MGEKKGKAETASTEKQVEGSQKAEEGEERKRPEPHPIAVAITTYLENLRDIETSARVYVPLSHERRHKLFRRIEREIKKDVEYLQQDEPEGRVMIMTRLLDALERLNRLNQSRAPQILESSLFLGMFSAYDIFTRDLLTAIYQKKPDLFRKVNRTIPVAEILEYDSFEALKVDVLQNEIETFRRKSYIEQFEELEGTFGLKLKAFERWPAFIECSQRRNLITHCGGIVSEQYLTVCAKEGCAFEPPVCVGDRLGLGDEYFLASCELMMEVGFKLGHTLWRKVFPDEMDVADGYMISIIYEDCLRFEKWDRAIIFGEFAVGQKNIASDATRKICTINYAIGLKFAGRTEDAKRVMGEVDWSGAAMDFKLAEAVLTDRYDDAAELMKKIGKKGEFIEEPFYHQWPLFHEFRKTDQFLKAYEKIYGHAFAIELQRAAKKTQAATKEQLEKVTTGDAVSRDSHAGSDSEDVTNDEASK